MDWMLRWVPVLVVAAIVLACGEYVGIGDIGHDIYYTNAATTDVFVYERTPSGTTPPYQVKPGETFHNSTLVPSESDRRRSTAKRRWAAKNDSGEVIFCHDYSYAELDQLNWRLTIRAQLDCGG